jgi:hypothetical protein
VREGGREGEGGERGKREREKEREEGRESPRYNERVCGRKMTSLACAVVRDRTHTHRCRCIVCLVIYCRECKDVRSSTPDLERQLCNPGQHVISFEYRF